MKNQSLVYYASNGKMLLLGVTCLAMGSLTYLFLTNSSDISNIEITHLLIILAAVILSELSRRFSKTEPSKYDADSQKNPTQLKIILFTFLSIATLIFLLRNNVLLTISLTMIVAGVIITSSIPRNKHPLLILNEEGFCYKKNLFSTLYITGNWSEVTGMKLAQASALGGGLLLQFKANLESPVFERYPKLKKIHASKLSQSLNVSALGVITTNLKGVSEKEFTEEIQNFARINRIPIEIEP